MKSRPNNIVKQIVRTKSPPLPATNPNPPQTQKPNSDLTSGFYPELNRLASADYKMRLSSPDLPR